MSSTMPRSSEHLLASKYASNVPVGNRLRIPAWLLSLFFHACVMAVLAYTVRFVPKGQSAEPDRTGGIVLVQSIEGKKEYLDEESAATSDASSATSLESTLPTAEENPVDLAGVLPSGNDISFADVGDSLPSAGQLTSGSGASAAIGGEARTKVFGVEGTGSRFVYVFDRSGSMDGFGGRPLRAAKSQLLASLGDLERIHQFQIIFYNEEPRIFRTDKNSPTLVWGDEGGKTRAARFVSAITADGATRHLPALQMALALQPDVVFFLTDADEPQMTEDELRRVRRGNSGASIHTIEFGFGAPIRRDNFLVRLAHQNGGQHAYVDVSRLRDDG